MSKQQLVPDNSSSDDDDKRNNDFDFSKWNTQTILENIGTSSRNVDVEQIDLTGSFDQKIKSKTKRLVIPVYILIGLGALIMIILALFGDSIGAIISIFAIIGMTWLGSIVGMLGSYAWGTVEECIDFFKQENTKFEGEIHGLKDSRIKLRDETQLVFFTVGKLKRGAKELEEHLHEFDKLRNDLQEVCKSNEDLNHLLDDVNAQYNDLVQMVANNERASLLSIYYEVSTKDQEEGLSKKEYSRFLGRLNDATKKYFIQCGTFEELAGDDNIMDLTEFERTLDWVIGKQAEEALQQALQ